MAACHSERSARAAHAEARNRRRPDREAYPFSAGGRGSNGRTPLDVRDVPCVASGHAV